MLAKEYKQEREQRIKQRTILAFKHEIVKMQMYTRICNPNIVLFRIFAIWQMKTDAKIVTAPLFDELFDKMDLRGRRAGGWIDEQAPLYRKAFYKIVTVSRLRQRQRCYEAHNAKA